MNSKDVIYIDVEDEITGIIDKVNSSKSKVVALVLPKRATVFQSVVNMKLLKRKATASKKQVVLVTSEAGLLPLAGATGVYVAKTLEAKPAIPPGPTEEDLDEGPVDVDDDDISEGDEDEEVDKSKPIGELAGAAAIGAVVAKGKKPTEDDAIEIDNDSDSQPLSTATTGATAAAAAKAKKPKKGKDKSLKVPDFNRFRKALIIGGISLVALIVLFILANKILPKATIIIQTNTQTVNTNLTATLDSSASSVNTSNATVPARIQTQQKTATSTAVNTTGTKTVGTSAAGSIYVSYPTGSCPHGCPSDSIPAGTVFTDSSGNFSYKSNSTNTIPGCTGHNCDPSSASVSVTAVNVGSGYNLTSQSGYTSSGSTTEGIPMSAFNLSGSTMSGGSSQNVQVVASADIASAQAQLTAPASSTIQTQLEQSLQSAGFIPMKGTFVAGTPSYTPSAAAGTQANSVTVTENTTYTMYGVTEANLNTLITYNVNQQIDPSKQSILDTGAKTASFTTASSTATSVTGNLQATSVVGAKLNVVAIKTQSLGAKSGDIKSAVNNLPGVTNVIVKYSPFWVTSTPKSPSKVTIVIQKSNGSTP